MYIKTFEEYLLLLEVNIDELLSMGTRRQNLFTPYKSEYIAFSFDAKNAYFKTGNHFQTIKFEDIKSISRLKGTDEEKVRMALDSDIKVNCSCEDWIFGGFKYMGTIMDYSIYKEKRKPSIKNPNEDGTVCKHLNYVLEHIDDSIENIVKDIQTARENGYRVVIHNKPEFSRYKK